MLAKQWLAIVEKVREAVKDQLEFPPWSHKHIKQNSQEMDLELTVPADKRRIILTSLLLGITKRAAEGCNAFGKHRTLSRIAI